MPGLWPSEPLLQLQTLQDLLSEELGLCLVLVDEEGREVTLPSGLPLTCYHAESQGEDCRAELLNLIGRAKLNSEPVTRQCRQGLYCMAYQIRLNHEHKKLFLVAGRTPCLDILQKHSRLLIAIYSLPLCFSIHENIPEGSRVKNASGRVGYDLTSQEKRILSLIGAGLSNKDIAAKLYISESTVKTHVTHILQKLNLSNRTEAAIFAVENGLVVREHREKN
ncbi:PocR sensory domain-containing protein [Thermanaeromonas toyohensis ToBE]|uniref:PocR sensory domain-containing protein n=1 Tax=Thermanaeromonas toyohensis ToBE TaxID=698762 RepID=A0A1W1VZU0_9FIRM|nr:LuxR family transcriptional regulator [Thermanaeromonas toyohensis]SMB98641.1 PocR sensory domain-containing protein [Thermanaeromonas toyohensis ToBE]